jgi:hypothetical protein
MALNVTLTSKPKVLTKKLLKELQDRARDVVVSRFGLEGTGERMTLEAIGQKYSITRERVRQIEHAALQALKKSETFTEAETILDELRQAITSLGGIVAESELLPAVSKDPVTQNHVHLYLVLGDDFSEEKENEKFKKRWIVDKEVAQRVHKALDDISAALGDHQLITENEMIDRVLCHDGVCEITSRKVTNDDAKRWLGISKIMAPNPLGEWGKAESPNVHTRGVRDYAYLVMRRHGSPMHFREVATAIEKTFGKPTHIATCHNELIKDERFVLVGRGVYALKEWGYKGGVVREVIEDIIKREGPLSKEVIVEKVLKERYLKRNTILVNLQNARYFTRLSDGRYTVAGGKEK